MGFIRFNLTVTAFVTDFRFCHLLIIYKSLHYFCPCHTDDLIFEKSRYDTSRSPDVMSSFNNDKLHCSINSTGKNSF